MISLDGDKLSDKYKIEPFMYSGNFDKHGIPYMKHEAEERIILNDVNYEYDGEDYLSELRYIKKYIIKIDIYNKYHQDDTIKKIIKKNPDINIEVH